MGKINDPEMADKIVEIIKTECAKIFQPDYEQKCDDFIDQHINDIIGNILDFINNDDDFQPEALCEKFGVCSSRCKFEVALRKSAYITNATNILNEIQHLTKRSSKLPF